MQWDFGQHNYYANTAWTNTLHCLRTTAFPLHPRSTTAFSLHRRLLAFSLHAPRPFSFTAAAHTPWALPPVRVARPHHLPYRTSESPALPHVRIACSTARPLGASTWPVRITCSTARPLGASTWPVRITCSTARPDRTSEWSVRSTHHLLYRPFRLHVQMVRPHGPDTSPALPPVLIARPNGPPSSHIRMVRPNRTSE